MKKNNLIIVLVFIAIFMILISNEEVIKGVQKSIQSSTSRIRIGVENTTPPGEEATEGELNITPPNETLEITENISKENITTNNKTKENIQENETIQEATVLEFPYETIIGILIILIISLFIIARKKKKKKKEIKRRKRKR